MSNTSTIDQTTIELATAALRSIDVATKPDVEQQVLRALPKALGYDSPADFMWAFRVANGLRNRRTILTPRKMKTLIRRTIAGDDRREIAADLGISPQTVSNVRVKLRLNPRKRVLG